MESMWATIVSRGAYLPGALVLAHCLEVVKSRYPLVILGTPSLSQQTRTLLAHVGIPYLIERTGLYPSREQHDPQNADARRRHLTEGLCHVREHLGWFRVEGPMLFLWAGENKRMWVACITNIIVFFSLPPITVAINISNSAPTQCGPFQVTWDHDTMAPSFYILPLNDRPVIGDNSTTFDSQAMTWNYTLNKLPLKIGTQFVVSLRYPVPGMAGYVSQIQTVGDSSDSSCVFTDPSPTSSFFTLFPSDLATCSNVIVLLNKTRYQGPPNIRVLIPGGQTMSLDPHGEDLAYILWNVNVRSGTQLIFFVESSTGRVADSRISPLITVAASTSDDCLSVVEFKSTAISSTVAASTTALPVSTITASIPGLPESTKKVNTPAIIGGVIGSLAGIAIICAAIVFYRSSKRKIPAFENSSVQRALPSIIAPAAPIWKQPLDVQEEQQLLERPSSHYRLLSKCPPIPPSMEVEQGASSTHPVANPLASVAPAQLDPARAPSSPVTTLRVGIERMGAYSTEDDDADQLVGGRGRTDGRLQRDESRENVTETRYVRHTDGGTVRVVELPPSYNEIQPQSEAF